MGITVTSLDELNTTLVDEQTTRVMALLSEKYPDVNLDRGVLHDLVAFLVGGQIGAVHATEAARLQQSQSLKLIEENPTLADTTVVDAILSNWGLARKPGGAATGEVTMVVSRDAAVVLPTGYALAANGVTFTTTTPITALPPGASPGAAGDRVMTAVGDGTYAFGFPVTATADGPAGNLRRRTALVPSFPPDSFVRAYSAGDFSGGIAVESNQELLQRQQEGVAAPVLAGRVNTFAVIRRQPLFENIPQMSLIGFGNPEMSRDRHWIWPSSGGGRADLYARTSTLPLDVALTVTASCVGYVGGSGLWQFTVPKAAFPGYYETATVYRLPAAAVIDGLPIHQQTRGKDLPTTGVVPDIATAGEAAFTCYQTVITQFVDPLTDQSTAPLGTRKNYSAILRGLPLIAELQDFVNSADNRYETGDLLVKAAVPCFVGVSFTLTQGVGEKTPDLDAIRQAVADTVNSLAFPGRLHASLISDAVHNFLSPRQAISKIYLHGRILLPDGLETHIQASDVLQIPDDPDRFVTGRTVALFSYPQDVGITVLTSGFTAAS